MIIFSLAGVMFYLIRKIAKKFPNFDKYGVKAVKLKEYQGGVLLGALFMLFQNKLINKLKLVTS